MCSLDMNVIDSYEGEQVPEDQMGSVHQNFPQRFHLRNLPRRHDQLRWRRDGEIRSIAAVSFTLGSHCRRRTCVSGDGGAPTGPPCPGSETEETATLHRRKNKLCPSVIPEDQSPFVCAPGETQKHVC